MQENCEKKQILEEDFVKGIKNDTKKTIFPSRYHAKQ